MSDGSSWRWCPQCGEHKDPRSFYDDRPQKGRQRLKRRSKCRACTRAQMRKRYEHRSQMVDDYKLAARCADCGWADHPRALEFDHLPGCVKVNNVAHMIANTKFTLAEIQAEMDKCDVVCANCHRIRTYNREHGNTDWDLRYASRVVRPETPEPGPEQLTLEV